MAMSQVGLPYFFHVDNMMENTEQQIDVIIETAKSSLICVAKSAEQVEVIKRRCDSLGHELKALSAIINNKDMLKAAIHRILALLAARW